MDALAVRFGVSVLNGISANKHVMDFVLFSYNLERSVHILQSILKTLPTDVRTRFTTGMYSSYPCIHLTASSESTDSIVVVYSSLVFLQ